MPLSALVPPSTDPTPIFETFRANYATELLTAAVAHLRVFDHLATGPRTQVDLAAALALAERPAQVLVTALRAMQLLAVEGTGKLMLTPMAHEHLVPGGAYYIGEYVGLLAESPGVLALTQRLRTNQPAAAASHDPGAAFIYRAGLESAMESADPARRLTLALAGRARNVAPLLARTLDLSAAQVLLDVGGGTGIYSIACLQQYPHLRAIVWDRPEVLKVAGEFAQAYGVADRLELRPGDMFADPFPGGADVLLYSNILHDWDVPECAQLVRKGAAVLGQGGRLVIQDVFLDDDLGGPLPLALYSATLFALTEGRAYSGAEYRGWLAAAGLTPGPIVSTLVHCGLLTGTKP